MMTQARGRVSADPLLEPGDHVVTVTGTWPAHEVSMASLHSHTRDCNHFAEGRLTEIEARVRGGKKATEGKASEELVMNWPVLARKSTAIESRRYREPRLPTSEWTEAS